ncbi:MAG: hypothetical protein MZU91_07135 [Desulfosudis oleivorans]|nr:hypothetical protein [Desulfosudis oleivorans]
MGHFLTKVSSASLRQTFVRFQILIAKISKSHAFDFTPNNLYLIQSHRKPNKSFSGTTGLEKGNYSLKMLPFFPVRLPGEPESPGLMPGPCFDIGKPRAGKVLGAARLTQYGPNIASLRKP